MNDSTRNDTAKNDFEQARITARQEARDRQSKIDRPTPIFRRTTTTPADFPEYQPGMTASAYLNQTIDSPITPRYDDAEIASVAGAVAHHVTRYVTDTDTWRSWDGTRWRTDRLSGQNALITLMGQSGDTESARIMPYTPETSDAKREQNEQVSVREGFAYEHDDVIYDADSDRPYMAVKYASATNARRLQGIASLMRSFVSCESTDFDANPSILATPAGHIDLDTMTQIDAMPESMTTKTTRAVFDPAVDWRESRWGAFLQEVLPDEEVRAYLRRVLGTALDPSIRLRRLPTLVGEGANGKSVLIDAVVDAMGDYGTVLSDKVVQGGENEHSAVLMPLRGARLAVVSETKPGQRWNTALLKSLSGGDVITARGMRQDPVSWTPTHQIVLATNHRPNVGAGEQAFWDRYREIVFPHRFVDDPTRDHERLIDRELSNTLRSPEERSAVLAWMMEGLDEYRLCGLCEPESVLDATREAQAEGSPFAVFVNEVFEVDQQNTQKLPARVAYLMWDVYRSETSALHRMAPNSEKAISVLAQEIDVEYEPRQNGHDYAGFLHVRLTEEGVDLMKRVRMGVEMGSLKASQSARAWLTENVSR